MKVSNVSIHSTASLKLGITCITESRPYAVYLIQVALADKVNFVWRMNLDTQRK